MSVYLISLFLHIAGALGLAAVLALEWASVYGFRRATALGQAREWARLLAAPRIVGGPASLIVLVTGIHLTATRWGPQGWIIVGLGGMVAIAVLGVALGGRRGSAIARALETEDDPIAPPLAHRLHDPVLTLLLTLRTALLLGVIFVMSGKPSAAGALAVLVVAAVLGAVAALPAWSRARVAVRANAAGSWSTR